MGGSEDKRVAESVPPPTVIRPEPVRATAVMGIPRIGIRQSFSGEHLWNARLQLRLAQARETDLQRDGFRGIDRELRAYVVAAVLESVAYLEAHVNAVWQDIVDVEPPNIPTTARLPQTPVAAIMRMRELWNTSRVERSLTVIEKYQVALTCADQPRVDLGAEPGQTVDAIIHLRNALVHDKPELQWLDQDHRLEKRLEPRIGPNPLTDSRPWFPHQVLTAKCARIAHDSAVTFAEDWRKRMNLTWSTVDQVDAFTDQLPTN